MAFDLKEEGDVKEYVEKLGIEYRFGCYNEKKPEVCHLLADYLEAIKKDFEKAAKVYRSNCDDYRFGKSCLKYGHYSFLGKGRVTNDAMQAYQYYEKGCQHGDADACLHSGLLLISKNKPKVMERDVSKAFNFLNKSCEMNNGTACFYLSGMFISGVTKTPEVNDKEYVFPKDMEKAFQYAQRACELRNMYACANLSQMYRNGDGTAKNPTLADKYKKLAMEMQDDLKNQKPQINFQQGIPSV